MRHIFLCTCTLFLVDEGISGWQGEVFFENHDRNAIQTNSTMMHRHTGGMAIDANIMQDQEMNSLAG